MTDCPSLKEHFFWHLPFHVSMSVKLSPQTISLLRLLFLTPSLLCFHVSESPRTIPLLRPLCLTPSLSCFQVGESPRTIPFLKLSFYERPPLPPFLTPSLSCFHVSEAIIKDIPLLTILLPCLPSLGKRPIKVPNLKSLRFPPPPPPPWACERISIKIRFVIGPSNTLFDSLYVCTFQPRTLTCCGSDGVKTIFSDTFPFMFPCQWIPHQGPPLF